MSDKPIPGGYIWVRVAEQIEKKVGQATKKLGQLRAEEVGYMTRVTVAAQVAALLTQIMLLVLKLKRTATAAFEAEQRKNQRLEAEIERLKNERPPEG
jgi:uncharacterized protein YecA (UPF0149 family)